LKAPLLIPIMQQHDRGDAQRPAAISAGAHLSLQVLQETIGEVVFRPLAPGGLPAPLPAVRADELNFSLPADRGSAPPSLCVEHQRFLQNANGGS
jgi:hypothetical protein